MGTSMSADPRILSVDIPQALVRLPSSGPTELKAAERHTRWPEVPANGVSIASVANLTF